MRQWLLVHDFFKIEKKKYTSILFFFNNKKRNTTTSIKDAEGPWRSCFFWPCIARLKKARWTLLQERIFCLCRVLYDRPASHAGLNAKGPLRSVVVQHLLVILAFARAKVITRIKQVHRFTERVRDTSCDRRMALIVYGKSRSDR